MEDKTLTTIGRAEKVNLIDLGFNHVPAKVDTGADASSIWAHSINQDNDKLEVIFFGPESPYYDGQVHKFPKSAYSITRVSSSFGHREIRYKLKLKIKVKGRIINGSFTLSDRSAKLYPILLGRSLLKHKFIVDVSKGRPLVAEEKERRAKLKEEILKLDEES
ncbi:MAG: RimK/LysX family protein [Candidatus Microsaccharimonas sp.]